MNDLISRQEVLYALKGLPTWWADKGGYYGGAQPPMVALLDPEDAVSAIENLPSAQPELKWIPCSERCPKEEQKEYWICTDTGYQCECRWTNVNHFWTDLTTSWHWHIMDVPQYTKVVAWMPLPEPYRGGDSE